MRPSPIQLQRIIYTKVSVAPNVDLGDASPRAIAFDFEGVNVKAKLGMAAKKGQEDEPRDFMVNLEILIDNKEGKPTPYAIDIGVIGLFNVLPSLDKNRREDLLTVNGASILYGAIREMVTSITSRFALGALTLPGMNFEDHEPSRKKALSESGKNGFVENKDTKPASSESKKSST